MPDTKGYTRGNDPAQAPQPPWLPVCFVGLCSWQLHVTGYNHLPRGNSVSRTASIDRIVRRIRCAALAVGLAVAGVCATTGTANAAESNGILANFTDEGPGPVAIWIVQKGHMHLLLPGQTTMGMGSISKFLWPTGHCGLISVNGGTYVRLDQRWHTMSVHTHNAVVHSTLCANGEPTEYF